MTDESMFKNRKKAEKMFKVKLPHYVEMCTAADEGGGVVAKTVLKDGCEPVHANTAFGAGLIVGALVAAGKKKAALAWLKGKK